MRIISIILLLSVSLSVHSEMIGVIDYSALNIQQMINLAIQDAFNMVQELAKK